MSDFTEFFVPTYKAWLGAQNDPFGLKLTTIASEMKKIWARVRPQDNYDIRVGTAVFRVASSSLLFLAAIHSYFFVALTDESENVGLEELNWESCSRGRQGAPPK